MNLYTTETYVVHGKSIPQFLYNNLKIIIFILENIVYKQIVEHSRVHRASQPFLKNKIFVHKLKPALK